MFGLQTQYDEYSDTHESFVMDGIEWLTTAEAAAIMGIRKQHVQYLCRLTENATDANQIEIECKRFGRVWMVSKASAENWKRKKSGRPRD